MAATDPKKFIGPATDPAQLSEPYPPIGYSWFVVGVLMVLYVFSFLDRTIMNLMVEPIKRDMGLSDTQMSMLLGPSFAILYSVLGVPFGRMADRMNRTWLIAGGLFVWTVMTAACGVARNYWQLLLFRIGVGVGEATLSPSAYSMVPDYFPPPKLGKAMSVYSMGIFIGAGIAMGAAGVVVGWTERLGRVSLPIFGEIYSWQTAFIICGLAGFVPLLVLFAVREPKRRGVRHIVGKDGKSRVETVTLGEFFRYQRSNARTITCHHLGGAILAFAGYGVGAWAPAFMMRTHGWDFERIGLLFMVHVIVAGCGGVVFGGILCDRLYRKGYRDAALRVALIGTAISVFPALLYPIVGNAWAAWGFMIASYFFSQFPTGVLAAAIQNMNPNTMRGTAAAVYLLVVNLIGLGLGPIGVALVTDLVFGDEAMLRYSMFIVLLATNLIGVAAFALGMKPFVESIKRAESYVPERQA